MTQTFICINVLDTNGNKKFSIVKDLYDLDKTDYFKNLLHFKSNPTRLFDNDFEVMNLTEISDDLKIKKYIINAVFDHTYNQTIYKLSKVNDILSFVFYCDYFLIKINNKNIQIDKDVFYKAIIKSIDLNNEHLFVLLKQISNTYVTYDSHSYNYSCNNHYKYQYQYKQYN